jgi:hypothetical protein
VESYRLLAKQIDQPLHLGITEAGGAQRRGEVGDRPGPAAVRRDRRYAARLAGGGSG